MRQRDLLSPEEARELDALERALAGDRVDPDLRELEELVHDIRATAPEMSPGFAAQLEHRVSEGFPVTPEHPAPRSPRRWVWLPAAGVLCASLLAVLAVLDNGTSNLGSMARDDATTPAARSGSGESLPPAADKLTQESAPPRPPVAAAAPAPSEDSATSSSGGSGSSGSAGFDRSQRDSTVAPARGERKVQRSADLVLRVPNARVQDANDAVIRTVDRFDGIVASSNSSSEGRHAEASFDLRIPTDRLDDALAALSKLGNVAQRNQNLVDITGSFTSAQDRLADARAERRGLLKALGSASTQRQIDSLRARLRNVRSQIARLNGDLAALKRRADMSTVSVTIRGSASESDEGTGTGGGTWSPGDAARDAVRVLEVIAGVLLIALAIVAPLGLLALIGAFGVRAARRHRRESALDTP